MIFSHNHLGDMQKIYFLETSIGPIDGDKFMIDFTPLRGKKKRIAFEEPGFYRAERNQIQEINTAH